MMGNETMDTTHPPQLGMTQTGAVAVLLAFALLVLTACTRPDAYVEIEIRDIDRYQAAVQWVNAQSEMPVWYRSTSAPSCVEVSEEIVSVRFTAVVYSVAIEDFDTQGFDGDYDPARLNVVDDSLAAIDQRRQVDTLATASYRAPRLDGLGDPSCPYMMFFSTPHENILLAEVLPKKYRKSDDYQDLVGHTTGIAYVFIFEGQSKIDKVHVGTINYD